MGKKAWEILNEDAEMYIMDIPQMKRPEDFKKKWEDEIHGYIRRIEELTVTRSLPKKQRCYCFSQQQEEALKRLNALQRT